MEKGNGIGSGVEYPTLVIGGVSYVVKFSRGALYRLDKAGFDLRQLGPQLQQWFPKKLDDGTEIPGNLRLSVLVDVLHSAIGDKFLGSPEQLAEALGENIAEAAIAVVQAIAKMKPSPQPSQETAANQTAIQ